MKKINILFLSFVMLILAFSNISFAETYRDFTLPITSAHFLLTSNADGNKIYRHEGALSDYCKECGTNTTTNASGVANITDERYQCRAITSEDIKTIIEKKAYKYDLWENANRNELCIYNQLKALATNEGFTIPEVSSKEEFLNSGITFSVGRSVDIVCGNDTPAVNRRIEIYATIRGINYNKCVVDTAVSPADSGTVTGGGEYDKNSQATLTATANSGWKFDHWEYSSETKNENNYSTSNPLTFDVTENCTLTAHFERDMYKLTLIADPSNGGTVKGAGTFAVGTSAPIEAIPNNDYVFSGWYEGSTFYSGEAKTSVKMNRDRTLTAKFTLKADYKLTLYVSPKDTGTAEGGGSYKDGDVATIKATPNDYQKFKNWTYTDTNTEYSKDAQTTVEMTGNISLTANFEPIKYNLKLNVSPSGAGTAVTSGSYNGGTTQTIKATANSNYTFEKWIYTGTNTEYSKDAQTTVKMTGDISLTAVFHPKYTLTVNISPADAGTVTGSGKYEKDYEATISTTGNPNYTFLGWEPASKVKDPNATTTTVTMDSNITVTAMYQSPVYHTLTIYSSPSEGGTVSVGDLGSGTRLTKDYLEGTTVNDILATPNNDWVCTGIKYSDGTTFSGDSVTMNQDITLIAYFERAQYYLDVKVYPDYVAVPQGNGMYESGTYVDVYPDNILSGWEFKGWTGDVEYLTKEDSIITGVVMPMESISVTATFEYVPDHVHVWDEEEWKDEYSEHLDDNSYPGAHIVSLGREQLGIEYIPSTSLLTPNHCPDINNIQGDPINSLYYIGEKVNLTGTVCKEDKTLSEEKYEVTCTKPKYVVKDGIKTEIPCNEKHSGIFKKVGESSIIETTKFPVEIKTNGIVLVDKDGNEIQSGIRKDYDGWDIGNYYIKKWEKVNYSTYLGTHYGIITVTGLCDCKDSDHNHIQQYYIPGPRPIPENVDVIVNILPPNSGSVQVTYQQVDSEGNLKTISETLTGEGKTLKVLERSSITVSVIESTESTYIHSVTKDGQVIEDKNYIYGVPIGGGEIDVVFVPKPNKYTLYVNSTTGGTATIIKNPSDLTVNKFNSDGTYREEVYEVYKDAEFTIKYKADSGYKFSGWIYSSYVENEEINPTTKIIMPASDLTVTANFEKIILPPELPTLKVMSNNDAWGNAYIELVTGDVTEVEGAIPGQEYVVKGIPNTGYMLIGWEHSSYTSPFKPVAEEAKRATAIMTDYDLTITAIFSPLPPPGTFSVTFSADPKEGGKVPENITGIINGSKVDKLYATPNKGYKFDHWEFYNLNGGRIYPDSFYEEDGTGYFIMPKYDVHAVAYFTKTNTVTVLVQGEGSVYVEDTIIPSGSYVEGADGENIPFYGRPDEDWKFKYWMTEDGDIITGNPSYIHTVTGDTTIIAVFEYVGGKYTLYVSSMFGGDAWIEEIIDPKGNYEIKNVGPDSLGKIVYKIENVYAGERFKLKYEVKEQGYEFGFWEYKPYISPDNESNGDGTGTIEITMPASDLTVTAIFKNDEVKIEPKLSITTNNAAWGSAWTKINGEQTVHDKKYDAVFGETYVLEYKAVTEPAPGYYFVGWNYSSIETPFIGENTIKMPSVNLEVMAMFSPIPEPNPGPNPDPDPIPGHAVDYIATPVEGGRVPDDLTDIVVGSEVPLQVTVNKGWEFDHWKFETVDGEAVSPDVYYDPSTGTGYFIMPDYEIKAIAVFKEKESYTLYITHYYGGDAWTYDNSGKKETTVKNAYVGDAYKIEYSLNPGYKFVRWEFSWDTEKESTKNPTIYKDQGFAVMPPSDMTVTAVFEEIIPTEEPILMVSTNNSYWGDAWVVVDGKSYHSEWVKVEAGKTYEVYYSPKDGFEFMKWSTYEYFEEYVPGVYGAILEMPNKKLELMAFFKPGSEEEKTFTLTAEADPFYAGTVSINGAGTELKNISSGESVKVIAEPNEGYRFKYWYTVVDGNDVKLSYKEEYSFKMPAKDYKVIAYFEVLDPGNGGGNGKNVYELSVEVIPSTAGSAGIGNYSTTSKYFIAGSECTVMVNPSSTIIDRGGNSYKYEFEGWFDGEDLKSTSMTYRFRMPAKKTHLVASFIESPIEETMTTVKDKICDSFKIVSVRDLNWKDYFIQNGNLNAERYFPIPKTNTTMLQNIGKYEQPIKMGYAVEFELITSGIELDNLELVITPKVYAADSNGNLVNGENDLLKKDSYGNRLLSATFGNVKYDEIVINKDSNGTGSFMGEAIDLKKNITVANTQIDTNETLWRWVYYLPHDTEVSTRADRSELTADELVVDFDIRLRELNNPAKDIVVNVQKMSGSTWKGYTFRYSLNHNLLEDIYDNAQN